jgi:multicomponent Na+:H+ antiporter subunit G
MMVSVRERGSLTGAIIVASIGAFVLLTTPVAGHVIARASHFADVPLWKGTVLDERRRDTERDTQNIPAMGNREPPRSESEPV